MGPSGCGKSTLLRIASGLLRATGGTVTIDRDHLGYVFQDATLLPWRTVRQNVELLAELRGMDKAERQRLAQAAIEMVGLSGFEQHYPKSLSGGMRMRCSLARTLTLKPPVFLFDEPFGAVDEITREHLNDQTLELFQAEGFAGLFITHSISEAVFMSTRVLVMSPRPGRIVAEFDVPFPYPRPPELRFDPAFAVLCGDISQGAARGDGMTDVDRDQAPGDAAGGPVVADPVSAAVTPSFTPPSAKREHWAAVVLPPLLLGTVVIGIWYFISYVLLDARRRFLLKPPHEVVQNGFLNWDAFSEILEALWSSAKVAFIGLAIAIVLGIGIAVLMSQTKLAERAIFPYMVALQAIPILALTPLISFWFGTNQTSRDHGLRDHLDLPDHPQHAVRAAVGRARDARPLHAGARHPLDAPEEADVPGRAAGDLRRAAHLRRALGDRRHRRRLLLRPGRRRHRSAAAQVLRQPPGRGAVHGGHHVVAARRRRLPVLRLAPATSHRQVGRRRRPAPMTAHHVRHHPPTT